MTGLLPPAVHPDGSVDPDGWSDHTMWWSERSRSRALLWPKDAPWFSNDPLGMRAHTHPAASEAFFIAAGTMRLTVGRTPLTLETGDYCLVPPDTYHDPLNVGDDDLCVWVFVAPNWRGSRWKASDFVESDYAGSGLVAPTSRPGPLPSDSLIQAEVLELAAGEEIPASGLPGVERAVYVLDGVLQIGIERLSGRLGPHEFVNIMAGAAHTLKADGSKDARVLSVTSADPDEETSSETGLHEPS